MTKIKADFPLNEEIKRCYFPGIIINLPCPNCKSIMTNDYSGDYISYAKTGLNKVNLYCDCEKSYEIDVDISLIATFKFDETKLKEVE
jgi:hypothetical protein